MQPALKPPTPAKDLTLPRLVDEFAITRARMMAFKPNVNPDAERFGELEEEVLKRAEWMNRGVKNLAARRIILHSDNWMLPISPMEKRSKLRNLTALFKRHGLKKFLEHCTVKLSAARSLPEKERGKFITTRRTGPREIGEPVRKEAA